MYGSLELPFMIKSLIVGAAIVIAHMFLRICSIIDARNSTPNWNFGLIMFSTSSMLR